MSSSEKDKNVLVKVAYGLKEQEIENKKILEENIQQIISKNYGGASVKIDYK